ncbi:MAG: protein TolR [Nevskiales bacterium]|nr:protein TolR [Nevskiales bacterium]
MAVRQKRKLASEINVVPYIDVMLVLLIIFMITAPLLTQGVEVDLPETGTEALATPSEPVTLFIDARGRYFLDIGADRSKSLSDDDVVGRVRAVLQHRPDTLILVRGDKRVAYERVAFGMSLLQEAGARKIGFAMEPLPRKPGAVPAPG